MSPIIFEKRRGLIRDEINSENCRLNLLGSYIDGKKSFL